MNVSPTKKGSKVSINALSSTLQVVITGLVYFLLYKFLLNRLGASQLGVWSLVMSTTSLGNLANFGLTSGLVKFVAEYKARSDHDRIPSLVITALITISVLFALITTLIYFGAPYFLKFIIEKKSLADALKILPLSLFSLIVNAIGGVLTSTLEGFQLNYQRHIIYVMGMISFAVFTYFLVPIWGLTGVGYAQDIQSIIVLAVSVFQVFRVLRPEGHLLRNVSAGWDYQIFQTLISYGLKFQLISICQMLFEPIVKGLLSKYSGLQSVAYYEMANRLVSQIRGLIISANQTMIPLIATAKLKSQSEVRYIYIKSIKIIFLVEVPLVTLMIIVTPLISVVWLNKIEPQFLIFLYLLLSATFVHILNGPAYFGILGEGRLSAMMLVYIIMLVVNVLLSYSFSIVIPDYGSVLGGIIAIITGTITMSYIYQKVNQIAFSDLFGKEEGYMIGIGLAISFLSAFLCSKFDTTAGIIISTLISLILFSITFIPLLLKNKAFNLLVVGFPKINNVLIKFKLQN